MGLFKNNHYDWLHQHYTTFLANMKVDHPEYYKGNITADGDKCYSYRELWNKHHIPFEHGVAIYLLSYNAPWFKESRDTEDGWYSPQDWVIDNYDRFKPFLPPAFKE